MITMNFEALPLAQATAPHLILLGSRAALSAETFRSTLPEALAAQWEHLLGQAQEGAKFAIAHTLLPLQGQLTKVSLHVISAQASRHNTSVRPDAIAASLRGLSIRENAQLFVALRDPSEAAAIAAAIARAFPLYSRKSKPAEAASLTVSFAPAQVDTEALQALAQAVREAARLVDTPPLELGPDAFVSEAQALAASRGLSCEVVRGEALLAAGFGGIYNVGKAANQAPALIHLSYTHPEASETIALVGKGVTYDTGGLSLKDKSGMPGMKTDMGGAAAVFQAFAFASSRQPKLNLHAVLCVVENAIGPEALRNDDVITLHAGHTIEINNTDAEGRLLLADGVSYAARTIGATTIIDLATLTGAQLVATGRLHAGVVSNSEALEAKAVAAGKASGDLTFPLPYAPEFYRAEFGSAVADFKNSVKDRANAQSSCAAQFVAEGLPAQTEAQWLHVDMAGPVTVGDRGTGYGVALLASLLGLI